jgi:hypothetical protein
VATTTLPRRRGRRGGGREPIPGVALALPLEDARARLRSPASRELGADAA